MTGVEDVISLLGLCVQVLVVERGHCGEAL